VFRCITNGVATPSPKPRMVFGQVLAIFPGQQPLMTWKTQKSCKYHEKQCFSGKPCVSKANWRRCVASSREIYQDYIRYKQMTIWHPPIHQFLSVFPSIHRKQMYIWHMFFSVFCVEMRMTAWQWHTYSNFMKICYYFCWQPFTNNRFLKHHCRQVSQSVSHEPSVVTHTGKAYAMQW
jgi:hypothetical protein